MPVFQIGGVSVPRRRILHGFPGFGRLVWLAVPVGLADRAAHSRQRAWAYCLRAAGVAVGPSLWACLELNVQLIFVIAINIPRVRIVVWPAVVGYN